MQNFHCDPNPNEVWGGWVGGWVGGGGKQMNYFRNDKEKSVTNKKQGCLYRKRK